MKPENAEAALRLRLSRRTALVTIDVQRAFFARDGSSALMGHDVEPAQRALPSIQRLHQLARAARVPIVHVRTEGRPWLNWPHHVTPPAMTDRLASAPAGTRFLDPLTDDVEFAPEAMPEADEAVITKHVLDSFNGTPLLFSLRQLRAQTLVLAGLTTECCVETTARSALCHGYAVVVAEDAVAAYDEERHRASLRVMSEFVGIVASVEEIANAGGW